MMHDDAINSCNVFACCYNIINCDYILENTTNQAYHVCFYNVYMILFASWVLNNQYT